MNAQWFILCGFMCLFYTLNRTQNSSFPVVSDGGWTLQARTTGGKYPHTLRTATDESPAYSLASVGEDWRTPGGLHRGASSALCTALWLFLFLSQGCRGCCPACTKWGGSWDNPSEAQGDLLAWKTGSPLPVHTCLCSRIVPAWVGKRNYSEAAGARERPYPSLSTHPENIFQWLLCARH